MRGLLIDDAAKASVQRVLDYALPKEHWYRPGKDPRVPGDAKHYVAYLEVGYRCVFTITEDRSTVFRHLSISIPSELYPDVIAAFTIAELFGFRGWDGKSFDLPASWMARVSTEEHCVVLAQPFEEVLAA